MNRKIQFSDEFFVIGYCLLLLDSKDISYQIYHFGIFERGYRMKFYACYKNCVFITDDYSLTEIEKGLHLKHLAQDLRTTRHPYMDVFDENAKFVTRIMREAA